MEQLYRLCLLVVGKNLESLTEEHHHIISDLPRNILHDLVFYLSPRKLYHLKNLFEMKQVNIDHAWEFHYRERWSYRHQTTPLIFKLLYYEKREKVRTFQYDYLEKHFQDVLRSSCFPECSQNSQLQRGMSYMLTSEYDHSVNRIIKCIPENVKEELTDLDIWIPFVSSLSILPSQCCKLLVINLRSKLRHYLKRLDIHLLQVKHLKNTVNLVADLIHNGRLEEVNVFNPKVDVDAFGYFLHVCAGHVLPSETNSQLEILKDASLRVGQSAAGVKARLAISCGSDKQNESDLCEINTSVNLHHQEKGNSDKKNEINDKEIMCDQEVNNTKTHTVMPVSSKCNTDTCLSDKAKETTDASYPQHGTTDLTDMCDAENEGNDLTIAYHEEVDRKDVQCDKIDIYSKPCDQTLGVSNTQNAEIGVSDIQHKKAVCGNHAAADEDDFDINKKDHKNRQEIVRSDSAGAKDDNIDHLKVIRKINGHKDAVIVQTTKDIEGDKEEVNDVKSDVNDVSTGQDENYDESPHDLSDTDEEIRKQDDCWYTDFSSSSYSSGTDSEAMDLYDFAVAAGQLHFSGMPEICLSEDDEDNDSEIFSMKDCICAEESHEIDSTKGLKAFSLAGILHQTNIEGHRISDVLNDVIPVWPKLEAISLSGFSVRDLFFPGTILRSAEPPGKLREIVLEDMTFLDGAVFDIMSGLITEETRKGPINRLKLINVHKEIYIEKEDLEALPEEFEGFIELEMRHVLLSSRAVKYLTTMISRDKALQHLILYDLNFRPLQTADIFQAIQTTNLQTLEFSGHYLEMSTVEHELCKIILSLPSLKTLCLRENSFSESFIISSAFISALHKARNLYELDLSGSFMHHKEEEFLGEILSASDSEKAQPSIQVINLSNTNCTGKKLVKKGQQLLNSEGDVLHLKKLNVSGNKLKKCEKQVTAVWKNFASEVIAFTENYDVPLAEHISQM